MFRRIVVPVEGAANDSAREAQVIEVARRLSEREGARLVLVHVDSADTADDRIATHAAIINRAAELRSADVPVSVHFASGAPGESIARTAREEHADLVVIAPHQRPLLRTLLRPGVTGQLMRRAPAPLLIWPEQALGARAGAISESALDAILAESTAAPAPIIVPLDGSPEAERALPLAAALALSHQRTLLLVTVAAALPAFAGVEMAYPAMAYTAGAELPEDRLREGLRYLGAVRRELRADIPELAVQTAGRIGEVAPRLAVLAAAHPGSVMVMATHGRGRALRLLLGSVATEMLSLTPVPLFIVPPQQRDWRRRDGARGRMEVARRKEAVEAVGAADFDEVVLEPAMNTPEPRPTC